MRSFGGDEQRNDHEARTADRTIGKWPAVVYGKERYFDETLRVKKQHVAPYPGL